jgi:hypothetical protein
MPKRSLNYEALETENLIQREEIEYLKRVNSIQCEEIEKLRSMLRKSRKPIEIATRMPIDSPIKASVSLH